MKKVCICLTLFFAMLSCIVSTCNAQKGVEEGPTDNLQIQVYLTKEQALKRAFPDCDEILFDKIVLSEDERKQLQNKLRRKIYENSFIVYFGIKSGKVKGYAVITEEVGKFHPYTFIVSVNRKGKINKIDVLVYRESRGAEIVRKRFLYQFKGKSLKDRIRINKDIINITGATMSVVTMCTGVKKVLTVLDRFYIKGNRAVNIDVLKRVEFGREEQNEELGLVKKSIVSMGTVFEVSIYTPDERNAEKVFNDTFKEVDRLDNLMSNYKEDSGLSKLNRSAASRPVSSSSELVYIIKQSLNYGDITDGAFDITIGPLMKKWGFYKDKGKVPTAEELKSVLKSVSYKNIDVDEAKNTISFKIPETEIDLGGIGKGHAVDSTLMILKESGIKTALINFAGNIYAYGAPPGRKSWIIGLQHPRKSGKLLGTFEVADKAVSTSGDYEKFFTIDGERYSHIIDPRTGNPVKGIVSVTIIADNATKADALSTGVFVLGLDKGMELVEKQPNVEGVIIYEDNNSELHIETSTGMKGIFKDISKESQTSPESDVIMTGS